MLSAAPPVRTGVVLVNFRTSGDTIECLESLLRIPDPELYRIVVVDNASGDGSPDCLKQWGQHAGMLCSEDQTVENNFDESASFRIIDSVGRPIQIDLIISSVNLGFAGGVNLGLRQLVADPDVSHCWLLNNDTVVRPHSLSSLAEVSAHHADLAIVGSTLVYYDSPDVVQAAGGARFLPLIARGRHALKHRTIQDLPADVRDLDYIVGASMFFSSQVLQKTGFMPEKYFLYFEEADWCRRAASKGVVLRWAKDSVVLHKEGRSTGARDRFAKLSDLAFYYICRNSMIFTRRYYWYCLPFALGFNLFVCSRYTFSGDGRKAKVLWRALRDFWRARDDSISADTV